MTKHDNCESIATIDAEDAGKFEIREHLREG
jgi:hypothetical protein